MQTGTRGTARRTAEVSPTDRLGNTGYHVEKECKERQINKRIVRESPAKHEERHGIKYLEYSI